MLITRCGAPVAELAPIERRATFVPAEQIRQAFAGAPRLDAMTADIAAAMDAPVRDSWA